MVYKEYWLILCPVTDFLLSTPVFPPHHVSGRQQGILSTFGARSCPLSTLLLLFHYPKAVYLWSCSQGLPVYDLLPALCLFTADCRSRLPGDSMLRPLNFLAFAPYLLAWAVPLLFTYTFSVVLTTESQSSALLIAPWILQTAFWFVPLPFTSH